MAPLTRSKRHDLLLDGRKSHSEYGTPQKSRFFNAFDTKDVNESLRSVASRTEVSKSTASRWLQQRDIMGSPSFRRTRKLSTRLGRKEIIAEEQCKMLVNPRENSVRKRKLDYQLEYHKINASVSTAQRALARIQITLGAISRRILRRKSLIKTVRIEKNTGKNIKTKQLCLFGNISTLRTKYTLIRTIRSEGIYSVSKAHV
ncbi:hypothetical protein M501DRAFT_284288 [Patellaria atrata CBS 101060]|uniref:Uncharacterized protein n=1 Tax=Patellaria atrata CBS 101060 TaxID=1346257 RepID=A0A9P4S584_9PEZI|nr:hypothetical protein M501DRAFT_284288 [Patellaria atrata CBS 101060]